MDAVQPPAQPAAPATPQQPATLVPADAPSGAASAQPDQPAFKKEELEQLLAPIALYPDSLLSQIFMASTYPLEIVEADRWVKANASLKGDALATELEKKDWDPSVKSLVNFPDILGMMSEKLELTRKLGDAFLGQQKDVMETVQRLRAKAQAQGNLKSSKEQVVKTEQSDAGTQVIVIESSSPEVVYVPQYNPTVVYGSWPYPSYPPYPYYPPYPPGYVASNVLSFGLGVACGAAWGYAWGNCNWGGNDVDIDINRNTNINNKIDRSKYKGGDRGVGQGGKGSFKHDPSHRGGVSYRNQSTADRVGAGRASAGTAQSRDAYRGRAEAGRQDISRGGADQFKGAGGANAGNRAGGANAGAGNRAGGGSGGVSVPSNRASGSSSGFSGVDRGGSAARAESSRGSTSRASSPSATSRSSGGGGAARSSGGGSRGGGGGGGRGGGGGGRR